MTTPRVNAPVHSKTLVEQKADFTAEGSPSPGNVAGSVPPVTKSDTDLLPASDARRTAKKGTAPPRPKGPARSSKYG